MNLNLTNLNSIESLKKYLYKEVENDLFNNLRINRDTCDPTTYKKQIDTEVEFMIMSDDYKEIISSFNKPNINIKRDQFTGEVFLVDEITIKEIDQVNNLIDEIVTTTPESYNDYVLGYKDVYDNIKVRFLTREGVDSLSVQYDIPVSEVLIQYVEQIGE
jgi:hypothetical protein